MYAVDDGRDLAEAVGDRSAHTEAFSAPRVVGVGDALLYRLAFELCEHDTDVEHRIAHRRRGVELLRRRYELDTVSCEFLHHIREIEYRAAYAVELVDYHGVD